MRIARRTLFVDMDELVKVFGLPEGVEILDIKKSQTYNEGFNFLLASAEEVYIGDLKVTTIEESNLNIRRIGLGSLRNARAELEAEKDRVK